MADENETMRPNIYKKPWEIYPEMREYPWVKDFDHMVANSKHKNSGGLSSEQPQVPVNLLLTVMREAALRPEVMDAFGSTPLDGQIPPKEGHLLQWYFDYLKHKYGTEPHPVGEMIIPMRKLANKYYSGLDDPKLKAELLARPLVSEDDGVNYD